MRGRPRAPLLLTRPTRAAGLSGGGARAVAAALLLVAILLLLVGRGAGVPIDGSAQASLTEAMRHGGGFYAVAADLARAGEPLGGLTRLPLPTLAVTLAAIPLVLGVLLLWALAAGVFLGWANVLRGATATRHVRTAALVLLACGMTAGLDPARIESREVWAGFLIALSLARWRRQGAVESVAFGLAAALVDDLAAAYLLTMALVALFTDRREGATWMLGLGLFAVVVALNVHATTALGLSSGKSWGTAPALTGWFAALAGSTALAPLPMPLASPLLALAAIGWLVWDSAHGLRVAATLFALLALAAIAPSDRTAGIALLAAPLWLLGLLFLPDGLRDLAGAALDKRRITVRRVVR